MEGDYCCWAEPDHWHMADHKCSAAGVRLDQAACSDSAVHSVVERREVVADNVLLVRAGKEDTDHHCKAEDKVGSLDRKVDAAVEVEISSCAHARLAHLL